MRTLYWDSINPDTGKPYTFDDPNLYWGSPSYVLEAGDQGYVPPPFEPNKPNKHTKPRMKRQRFFPARAGSQVLWLDNYVAKLANHAVPVGLSPAALTATIADARWLIYIIGTWLPAVRAWQKSCTDAVEEAKYGPGGGMVLPVFVPPPLPPASADPGGLPAVVPVPKGALTRILDLVGQMKEEPGCTETVATDLQFVGIEDLGPDLDTITPDLSGMAKANRVELDWGWQGFSAFLDQCEIQVDRGDGQGWRVLTFDTTPGYNDTQPFPATLARWKYRAIYRVDDQPVGVWSPEVVVTVGGA